jgi:hypothetical protein
MPLYIDADLITDETAVAEAVLAGIADRINAALGLDPDEGWEPQEGSPETSLAEAAGIIIAAACAMVQETERNDYAGFGELILRVPRTTAEPAVGYSRWEFSSVGDHEIPDGSEVTMVAADGTPVGFATVGDVVFTGAAATDVQVVALEPGTIANGLLGGAIDYEGLPFLVGVTMTTAPTGGTDEETRDEYLDLVVRRARRLKDVPIVTDDYADTALDDPSVAAAMAVRLLNAEAYPGPPNSEGFVKIFTRDAAGQPSAPGVDTNVIALMQGEDRPLGVTVTHGDPTYTDITIAVSIRLTVGADEDATVAAAQAAVSAAYDPAAYDFDPDAPGNWRPPVTTEDRTINAFDVAGLIDDLEGIAKVVAVTINGGASVVLDGWAPLPNLTAPPTITVV